MIDCDCEFNQTHLIPPILTYVRLHTRRFVVFYPPLRAIKSRVCILIPLTPGLVQLDRGTIQRRLSSSGSPMRQHLRGVLLERFVWCGLKGKTRPGDAHPYLVSFYLAAFGLIVQTCSFSYRFAGLFPQLKS